MATLRKRGVEIVEPITKTLACGDKGNGAMAAPETIVAQVLAKMTAYQEVLAEAKRAGKLPLA